MNNLVAKHNHNKAQTFKCRKRASKKIRGQKHKAKYFA